jgi:hypothetical protein
LKTEINEINERITRKETEYREGENILSVTKKVGSSGGFYVLSIGGCLCRLFKGLDLEYLSLDTQAARCMDGISLVVSCTVYPLSRCSGTLQYLTLANPIKPNQTLPVSTPRLIDRGKDELEYHSDGCVITNVSHIAKTKDIR